MQTEVDAKVDAASRVPAHPLSYWAATAAPPPLLPRLQGDKRCDVAIIGGGFTGLSTAYHLGRDGVDCLVLDGMDVGSGASGRNGGMLVPRYKKGFASIARQYGNEVTRLMYRTVHEAIDTVESIVADCSIDCSFGRVGQLTAAHSEKHLLNLKEDSDWMLAEAGDRKARILSRAEMVDEIGTRVHVGGWLDPRGASIHPLNYVRGLASVLHQRGVSIYVHSPVLRLADDGDVIHIETPDGCIRANQVVICTNAYTDATSFAPHRLQCRVIPVTTSIIATQALASDVSTTVLPSRRVVADTKHLMNYYRIMPDNSVLFGGRGDITGRSDDPKVYSMLEEQLASTFPQIAGAKIMHRWSGRVAITLDDFPHIGRLSPRIAFALGYGGRGVALSNLMGKLLARVVRNEPIEAGPMTSNRFRPIPFHRFRIPGMRIVAGWYRFLDSRTSGGTWT